MAESGDRALLLALPLPLAQAWRRALYADAPIDLHDRALFTLEASLKYLASVAAMTWIAQGARGEHPRKSCEALVRPSLGHWRAILRHCRGALPESDPARRWLDRVMEHAVRTDLPLLKGRRVRVILNALPSYRNTLAHGAGLNPDAATERAPQVLGLAREVLASLIGDDAATLLGRTGSRVVSLTGPAALPAVRDLGTIAAELVVQFPGRITPLSPLWVFDAAQDDVLVLNKGAGLNKVEYLSYGVAYGETGLTVRKGLAAEDAARFLETATGRRKLGAGEVDRMVEETEARELAEQATGEHIGPFRVVRQLARGGQGVLHEAIEEDPPRRVALKVLSIHGAVDEESRRRFREEAEMLAKVDHPGVVAVYTTGEHEGVPWIAMKFIEGKSLAQTIRTLRNHTGVLTLRDWNEAAGVDEDLADTTSRKPHARRVAEIGRDVARALAACHARHIVHRDVKPGNVMLDPDGKALLTDFGVARSMSLRDATLTRTFIGTLHYAAPEALVHEHRRAPDERIDVYGLGSTLYEALCLKRPFHDFASNETSLRHAVLTKDPPPPDKVAPWVPRELSVIIAKAMEKDFERRYESAAAFADDLDRFLSGEPIAARPPGAVVRTLKWVRRNRPRAVAIAAVVLAILIPCGVFVAQALRAKAAHDRHLADGRAALARGDHDTALEAAARALERARSEAALLLEEQAKNAREKAIQESIKQDALRMAREAREEAGRTNATYSRLRGEYEKLRTETEKLRDACFKDFASDAARGRLNRRENELRDREDRLDELLLEGRERLERAARFENPHYPEGMSAETRSAFTGWFYGRWHEAVTGGDEAEARRLEKRVRVYDDKKRHEAALGGRGALTVTVNAAEAEVHLFRYEAYETVRTSPPVVSRLVPVPTGGTRPIKPGAWTGDFHPGDPCLVITSVADGSVAARQGLRHGDLVIALNGHPCGEGLFVGALRPEGAAEAAGIRVLDRIQKVDGLEIRGLYDWHEAARAAADRSCRLTAGGKTAEGQCAPLPGGYETESLAVLQAMSRSGDAQLPPSFRLLQTAFGAQAVAAADLIRTVTPYEKTLTCLRGGRAVDVVIPGGERPGMSCETTAYPLIAADANRIRAGEAIVVDPGSYLLLIRAQGREDQRFPVLVKRGSRAKVAVKLLPTGSTPPGFVHVPGGPFLAGGDADALDARPAREIDIPGFFIARTEVTNRHWIPFLKDPTTLDRLEKNEGPPELVPRQEKGETLLWKFELDRNRYVPKSSGFDAPLYGISLNDIKAYLAWRNARARADGDRWRYALPGDLEWQKAARGVDGRAFPWGNRFDYSLAVSRYHRRGVSGLWLASERGRFQPRDESPYGVADLAGSRTEWTAAPYSPDLADAAQTFRVFGGSWRTGEVNSFRIASRMFLVPGTVSPTIGFRLVARPAK